MRPQSEDLPASSSLLGIPKLFASRIFSASQRPVPWVSLASHIDSAGRRRECPLLDDGDAAQVLESVEPIDPVGQK